MVRQVVSLQVKNLFGYLDHSLEFPLDRDFTIIYGANGVGKTTVLRILQEVLQGRLEELGAIPFDRLEVRFDDESVLEIDSAILDEEDEEDRALRARFTDALTGEETIDALRRRRMRPSLRRWLLSDTSWRPVERGLWQDMTDGELLDEAALVEMFAGFRGIPAARAERADRSTEPDDRIAKALQVVPPFSILTERLGTREVASRAGRLRMTETVARYSDEVREEVASAFTQDAVLSQELDRTFPSRLLQDDIRVTPTDAEIRQLYDDQVKRRARLRRIGLIGGMSDISLPDGEIADWKRRTLALFLDDADARLKQLEEFVPRFSLLYEMMNSRLVGKQLQISDKGIRAVIAATGKELPPTRLSSGEQHELILTYGLIFHSQAAQLVLIDEPEISLHAAWQRQFLPDLQRIFELTGARAVIATHSPMIVDRWSENTIELSS